MSATSKTVGSGFLGWVGHLADAASGFPGRYGHLLATKRRKTIALTILTVVAIAYPVLYQQVLAPFSRNVFPLPLPSDTEVTFMMIFGIMAIGLNIVAGFAGLLDLGYVAFYAIGAYTAAFFASPHFGSVSIVLFANVASGFPGIHLPFWIVLPAAALIAATFGALLGAPTLRLRGDYLAIVTLGFGEIVPVFFKNLAAITFSFSIAGVTLISLQNVNLTGGPLGINPIDPFVILGVGFGATSGVAAPYFGMVLMLIAIVVARNLERSRMGRAWGAIREDETAAEMMGVNTVRTKLLAFALGASFAGVAGAFQASYLGATTSDFFQFSTSILVLIMVILGGIGNIWGVLAGAIALAYIDKTFLPWLGQRIGRRRARLPEPVPVQLPDLRDPARGDDAVPAGGLPAEPPARRRAQRPRPPGRRGGDGRRGRDGQRRARAARRRPSWTAGRRLPTRWRTNDRQHDGRRADRRRPRRPDPRPGPRRHEAVRRPRGGQQRRLRHPAHVDRLADRPERGGQDDLLQHDHRRLRPDRRRDRVRRPPDRLHEGQEAPLAQAPRGDRAGDRPDVPEHPAVRHDVRAGQRPGRHPRPPQEPLVGRDPAHADRCSTRRSTRSTRGCACSSWSVSSAGRRPGRATCRTATSAASRSPARSPRGRSSSCSTSRRPA